LEILAKTYADETADSPIKVNIIDPGATATRMRAEAYPGEDQSTLRTPEALAEAFVPLAMPDWLETGEIVSTLGRRSAVRSQHQAVIGWLDAVRELAREPRIIEIDMHVGQHGALGLDLRNP